MSMGLLQNCFAGQFGRSLGFFCQPKQQSEFSLMEDKKKACILFSKLQLAPRSGI